MESYLYLMRHGETLFNKLKKVQGACDSPLTEEGIHQAQAARLYFKEKEIVFDHAYSSTQERASDTLELIADIPYTRLKGLKEMNFGQFEGERVELQPKGPETFESFYVPFGGDSAKEVQERIYTTLQKIMCTSNHNNVLAVSHNGACFYFISKIWKSEYGAVPIHFPNCCIFVISYKNNEFNLIEIINPCIKRSIFKL